MCVPNAMEIHSIVKTQNPKCEPNGGARGKVRGSLK